VNARTCCCRKERTANHRHGQEVQRRQDHGFTRNGGAAGRKDEMALGFTGHAGTGGRRNQGQTGHFRGVGHGDVRRGREKPTGKAARPERRPESRACPPPAAKVKKVKARGVPCPYLSVLFCTVPSASPMLFWRLLRAFCCSRLRQWPSLLETVLHYAASVVNH
jgi:hypothetical protein